MRRVWGRSGRSPRILGAAVLACVLAAAVTIGAAPASAAGPSLSADAAILIEPQTGDIVVRRGIDRELLIASTTKMMTALVARRKKALDDVITVRPYDGLPDESLARIRPGDRMTVRDLIRAMLLPSGNDAAATLAEGTSGSRARFVRAMNAEARRLRLRHTRFANPIGLDSGGRNYSSARDLSVIAQELRRDPFLRDTVDLRSARLITADPPKTVRNRNALVRTTWWVNGIKTGFTPAAGYNLAGSATRRGVTLVSVVLGAPSDGDRYADTLALLRYGLARYRSARVLRRGRVLAQARVEGRPDERIDLVAGRDVARVLRRGERTQVSVRGPDELEGPIPRGRRVGTILVRQRGRTVARAPLVTGEAVPEVPLVERLTSDTPLMVGVLIGAALVGSLLLGIGLARRRRGPQRARAPKAQSA